jgi:hypothetical protein
VRPPSLREERYGAPRPARRRIVVVAVAALAVVFLGWLGWAAWFQANPAVTSDLVTYDVADPHRAVATVQVSLADDAHDVRCLVRAIAEDHTPVGEASFVPTAGRNEVAIRTERAATTVTLVGCTATGQQRPR